MDRRKQDRVKRRLTCELVADGQRFSAIVLDMSPTGIFVQTAAKLARETEVQVRILGNECDAPIDLRARVARRRNAPPHLASVSSSGIGLEIRQAPGAYYEQLGVASRAGRSEPLQPDAARRPDAGDPEAEEPEAPRFRVRIRHSESCRSRTVSVNAPDDDSARALVLEEAGDDWEVLGCDAA